MIKSAAKLDRDQSILIVEDDVTDAQKLQRAFSAGREVKVAHDLQTANAALKAWPDLIILDAMFPPRAGATPAFLAAELLDAIENACDEEGRELPDIILVSGQKEAAEQFDEIANWLDVGRIRDVLPKQVADVGWEIFQAILRHKANGLQRDRALRGALKAAEGALASLRDNQIITCDERMALKLWDGITHAARAGRNVFIQGESGTGKELVAKAIAHLVGPDILTINCAATPSELFESEFYGTVKGAFNNAHDQEGLIEKAANKYLFMDEVCKLLPRHQSSLLRVTDEKIREFKRVGDTRIRKATCSFIFADSIPIWGAVDKGDFSAELAYRLTSIEIELPPLRERWSADGRSDVRLLMRYFLDRYNVERQKSVELTEEVYSIFERGYWAGNVRALEQFIRNIVDTSDNIVTFDQVKKRIGEQKLGRELRIDQNLYALSGLHRRPALDVVIPTDPEQLLSLLTKELADAAPRFWLKLGDRSIKEDAEREHEHEPLIREALKLVLDSRVVDNLRQTLKARNNNDPRRINIYKTLLYLKLHPSHEADLDDFGRIADLKSWLSKKKIGDGLLASLPLVSVRATEDKNRYIYWLEERANVYK
jgi:DNA-binding NtrC family response regulator